MSDSIWHYPRKTFTHDVFVSLTRGPIAAMTLFGPRRTGKTEFLLKYLGFHADNRYGHRILYASFWQTGTDPLATLLYASEEALSARNYSDRLRVWAKELPVKVRLSALKGMAEVEVDLGRDKSPTPDNDLLRLDAYLEKLSNPKKPTLLLLDEAQELAEHAQGEGMMAALRTTLDRRKDGLKTVFSGSSQVGLNKVFNDRKAPFYRFAQPLYLPALDTDFVDHQLKAFRSVYQREVDRNLALSLFEEFDRSPLFFQRWLMTLGTYRHLDAEAAKTQTIDDLARDLEFDTNWRKMKPYHRAMTRILAERIPEPLGETGAKRYLEILGTDAPAGTTRQSYIRTLVRRGFADQWDDEWRLSDPIFTTWVLARPDNAF